MPEEQSLSLLGQGTAAAGRGCACWGHALAALGSAYTRKDFVLASPKCPLSKYLVQASCCLLVVGPQLWEVMEGKGRDAVSEL